MANACKFSPENSKIEIEVKLAYGNENQSEKSDGYDVSAGLGELTTIITDYGKGIPANKMAGLFETFSILKSGLK